MDIVMTKPLTVVSEGMLVALTWALRTTGYDTRREAEDQGLLPDEPDGDPDSVRALLECIFIDRLERFAAESPDVRPAPEEPRYIDGPDGVNLAGWMVPYEKLDLIPGLTYRGTGSPQVHEALWQWASAKVWSRDRRYREPYGMLLLDEVHAVACPPELEVGDPLSGD